MLIKNDTNLQTGAGQSGAVGALAVQPVVTVSEKDHDFVQNHFFQSCLTSHSAGA